nr:retrovirus-related Pol polyprotein from transposon TNT 1-94 [Tanacetum cinerariifolium]
MMNLTTLPKSFWGYALETAARILNMVPTKKVDRTPYVIWYEKAPSRFQQNPVEIYKTVVKTILKYWRNAEDMVLVYGAKPEDELKSAKQSTTDLSSVESKYIGAAKASMEAVWMRTFIDGLGCVMPSDKRPMEMVCDNKPALAVASDIGILKGARHFLGIYHYICEVIQEDHLGKFDEKADYGFFLGYSLVAKAFRVFNIRRQEKEETYHVTFSKDDEAIIKSSTAGDEINFNENRFFLDDEFLVPRSKVSQCSGKDDYFPYVTAHDPLSIKNITIHDTVTPTL